MTAEPIKVAPAEARRRIRKMIENHKWHLDLLRSNTRLAKDVGSRIEFYFDMVSLEMALEAMKAIKD